MTKRNRIQAALDRAKANPPRKPFNLPPRGSVAVARAGGPNSVVDDATAAARKAICLTCEHHGDQTEMTGHCRKLGSRPSCAGCRVVFKTSPASRCPLAFWPA